MSMPFVSVTMLQALFGYYLPDGLIAEPRPEAAADDAYPAGAKGAWIAEDRGSGNGPNDRQAA